MSTTAKMMNITQRNHLIKRLDGVMEIKIREICERHEKPSLLDYAKDHAPRKTFTTADLIKMYEDEGSNYIYLKQLFGESFIDAYNAQCRTISETKCEEVEKLQKFHQDLKDQIIFDVSCAEAVDMIKKLQDWKP